MASDVSVKLGVEGEAELKSSLALASQQVKTFGAEVQAMSSKVGVSATEEEAAAKKAELLGKAMDAQKQKIAAQNEMLQKSIDRTGENSIESEKWRTKIAQSEAELSKMEKSLQDENGKLKENQEETKKSGDESEKASSKFAGMGKALASAAAAIGAAAAAAAGAMAKLTVDASKMADDLITQSTFTRQSTDDLQKYAYAARFVDVDMEKLTGSMTKNIKSMSNAADGSKKYAEAYKTLGVAVTDADGNLRDSTTVYWETIDALGSVENETERDALAMQLFGKSAQELNSVINAGSEEFKKLGDQAEEMGFIMGKDSVKALGDFNDKLQILEAGADGVKNSMSLVALPFLNEMADKGIPILQNFGKAVSQAGGDTKLMAEAIGTGIGEVINLVLEGMPQLIEMGLTIVENIVTGIVQNLPALLDGAMQIITMIGESLLTFAPQLITAATDLVIEMATFITENAPSIIPAVFQIVETIGHSLIDNAPRLIQAAFELVGNLVTGIIDDLPHVIESATQIINSLLTELLNHMPELIDGALQLIMAIQQGLLDNLPLIIEATIQLISTLLLTILEHLPEIIASGINMVENLVIGLVQALPKVVTAIVQLANSVVDTIKEKGQSFVDAGKNIVEGLVNGIKNAAHRVKEAIMDIAEQAWESVKNFFGIESPSKLMRDTIGKNIMLGWAEGLNRYKDATIGMAKAVSAEVVNSFDQMAAVPTMAIAGNTADISLTSVLTLDGDPIATIIDRRLGVRL